MVAVDEKVSERMLTEIWRRQLVDQKNLLTSEGRKVQVISPGRRNNDRGPDFLDAAVAVEGVGMLRGDVELHVRARDWWAHGHHRDRNYDGVVLHVVMWEGDCPSSRLLRSGKGVQILPLQGCLGEPLKERPVHPCAGAVGILFATFQAVGGFVTGQDVRRYLLAMALVAGGLLVFAWFCIGVLLIRYLSFRMSLRRGFSKPTEYVDAWKIAGERLQVPDDED